METDAGSVEQRAKTILRCAKKSGASTFSKRELHQLVRGNSTMRLADDLDAPLELLCSTEHLRRLPPPPPDAGRPGRKPSPRYEIFAGAGSDKTDPILDPIRSALGIVGGSPEFLAAEINKLDTGRLDVLDRHFPGLDAAEVEVRVVELLYAERTLREAVRHAKAD